MSASVDMTLTEFAALLETYGAAPERWPAARRQPALQLLAHSAEAQCLAKAEAAFDKILWAADPVRMSAREREPSAASPALVERLVAARPRPAEHNSQTKAHAERSKPSPRAKGLRAFLATLWPYGSPAIPAALLIVATLSGAGLGVVGVERIAPETAVADNEASYDAPISVALLDTTYAEEWQP